MKNLFFLIVIILEIGCQTPRDNTDDFLMLKGALIESNHVIRRQIDEALMKLIQNGIDKSNYRPLSNKANAIVRLYDDLNASLSTVRDTLYTALEINTYETYQQNITKNSAMAAQLLLQNEFSLGVGIAEKIRYTRQAYLDTIASLWDEEIRSTMFYDKSKKEESMKHLESMLNLDTIANPANWTQATFGGKSAANILAILTKTENDNAQDCLELLSYFLHQTTYRSMCGFYSTVDIHHQAKSPVVHLGEQYKGTFELGIFSNEHEYRLCIDGDTISSEGGIVYYEHQPQTTGRKTLDATILLYNPLTGETKKFTRQFQYEVLPNK